MAFNSPFLSSVLREKLFDSHGYLVSIRRKTLKSMKMTIWAHQKSSVNNLCRAKVQLKSEQITTVKLKSFHRLFRSSAIF